MHKRREGFNPFIVLSDVTISTLVVLACLLMLFSAVVASSAQAQRRKAQQATAIQQVQRSLFSQRKKGWPDRLPILNAQGLQSYLYRFAGNELFERRSRGNLSRKGRDCLRTFAAVWGPRLRELQARQTGALIEIQVQGHCSRGAGSDPWGLSTQRALAAGRILAESPGFPSHLLSVSGYGWHRLAYPATNSVIQNRRLQMRRSPAGKKLTDEQILSRLKQEGYTKVPYPDRIDILLVFAGDQFDNNYIAPSDAERRYGPENDVSVPYLTELR